MTPLHSCFNLVAMTMKFPLYLVISGAPYISATLYKLPLSYINNTLSELCQLVLWKCLILYNYYYMITSDVAS